MKFEDIQSFKKQNIHFNESINQYYIDDDFFFVGIPDSINSNTIHMFIDPNKLYDNKHVLSGEHWVLLISNKIQMNKLSYINDVFIQDKNIIFYFNKNNIYDYLFLSILRLEGFFETKIDNNEVIITNNKNTINFNLENIEPHKLLLQLKKQFKKYSNININLN